MAEVHDPGVFEQGVMVDVGQGAGALIVYAGAELQGREVEISPIGDEMNRIHAEFLRRSTPAGELYAAVFGSVAEGRYRVWHRTAAQRREVRIVGGQVTEVDWR